ncbi:MAG: DUF6580 family putative transport protein [Bryobacteraceae bacterium]
MTKPNANTSSALAISILGALLRLIPHPPNFAPVGAVSLFSGARLNGWQAYLVPLILMAFTDPIISYVRHAGAAAYSDKTLFSYASFLISVWIGRHLSATNSPVRIGAASVICAAQFFLISNFAVWLLGTMYPHNFGGLIACYVAAIPFFGNTLASNLVYTAVFFGAYEWLDRRREVAAVRP